MWYFLVMTVVVVLAISKMILALVSYIVVCMLIVYYTLDPVQWFSEIFFGIEFFLFQISLSLDDP